MAGAAGGGLHLPGVSGPGSGLGSPVRHRHRLWVEQSPCAALGLLLDLPCADLRRKRPHPLLFRIPLARVLFECLPRRVRVEILRSAKAQGVSAWRGSCAAVRGAGQGATRAGQGAAQGGGRAAAPPSPNPLPSRRSAAPRPHRPADATVTKPQVRNVRRWCMSSVGHMLRRRGGVGRGHRALARVLRGHFSLVARSHTCEHGNQ